MSLHEACRPLAFLLGRWRGVGRGEYPTIDAFEYGEEVIFSHVGKPFLAYQQRTWRLDDRGPLHAECGYWRSLGEGRLEVVLAHPFGAVEVLEGTLASGCVRLASQQVGLTTSAKEIDATERDFDVADAELRYRVRMAALGQPMTHHLAATLKRVDEDAGEPGAER